MTDQAKVDDILKANNPFSSNAAGDPREDRWPDVPGLGDDVFLGLKSLFSQKAENPSMPCASAVLGEAGSGKTHLIGRLIDESKTGRAPFSFAYIPPFIDPSQGFRYLLREIVVNLTRGLGPSSRGQLDFLAGNIMIHVLAAAAQTAGSDRLGKIAEKCKGNPRDALRLKITPPEMRKKLVKYGLRLFSREIPELFPDFVKVLLQYCFFHARRSGAVQWLMGRAVDVDHLKMLGVRDRSGA
ncbi:MAG: hypothetical protein GY859_11800, partial [Desulfobacterales bacterium]|nr:hypothetical protein [Desulfobacterales bacterium]